MPSDTDLLKLTKDIHSLEGRFVNSSALGLHLRADDEAEFKRLVVEAKAILDSELGRLNDFSSNLIHAINSNSGGFLGGPSLAAVKSARAVIEGGVNHIRRRATPGPSASSASAKPSYVDPSRLAELRAISSKDWDLRRLIRLLEELNGASSNNCHMTVAMLVRAIVDHIPPVLGFNTFDQVANNYASPKSFKSSMQHLNNSLRNIADAHLHLHIRRAEVLPNESQVNFRADLDVLLGEIVRLLR